MEPQFLLLPVRNYLCSKKSTKKSMTTFSHVHPGCFTWICLLLSLTVEAGPTKDRVRVKRGNVQAR